MRQFNNPLSATLAGLTDQLRRRRGGAELDDSERLDGRTCLVTGANSGLGKAAAIELAARGARVIMACRGGIPDAGQDVRNSSGSDAVEMMHVDLSDFDSVNRLCDQLRDRKLRLDVVVLNAGVMPRSSRRTRHGFELMFQVNYLASVLLVHRLLADGVIPNRIFSGGGSGASEDDATAPRPRIIFVASEAHRTAKPLDLGSLGGYVEYGVVTGMAQYAHTKLAILTFAAELARRLRDERGIDVAVHAICPGPVDTNMAREAPLWLKPLLKPVMRAFFSSPAVAARPLVYLACARALETETGRYLHMTQTKEPSASACDVAAGRGLWEASERLLQRAHAIDAVG